MLCSPLIDIFFIFRCTDIVLYCRWLFPMCITSQKLLHSDSRYYHWQHIVFYHSHLNALCMVCALLLQTIPKCSVAEVKMPIVNMNMSHITLICKIFRELLLLECFTVASSTCFYCTWTSALKQGWAKAPCTRNPRYLFYLHFIPHITAVASSSNSRTLWTLSLGCIYPTSSIQPFAAAILFTSFTLRCSLITLKHC